MNDQDLPEDGPNPMAAALATGALANATADEDGMAQDDTPVAVDDVVLDDAELLDDDDEFGTDDDLEDDAEGEFDDEELAAMKMKNKMEEFFAADPLGEEFSELDVLSLEEAATYLKIEFGDLRRMIKEQGLPGRKIGDEWRFLRGAIADWLRAPGGSATPTAQPEKPVRSERPARAERPAFEERPQREERPRRRFPDIEVSVDEGYPPRSQPPRPRPQFRSQNQFGGGAEGGGYQGAGNQGGAGQGSYPPPRRGRYESDQQQQPPQGEYQPPRKRPPFRENQGGQPGGRQFGGAQGGAAQGGAAQGGEGQEGGRRFVGGPKKPKREALGNQRFKRLDRRRFGSDQGE